MASSTRASIIASVRTPSSEEYAAAWKEQWGIWTITWQKSNFKFQNRTINLPARPRPVWRSLFQTFPLSASLSLSIFYHSQTEPASSSCTKKQHRCFLFLSECHHNSRPSVPSGLYSLSPPSGRLQHVFVKVQPHQSFPLLRTWQGKVYYLVYTVIDGPVKLLRLVTGQDQHEPTGKEPELCWQGRSHSATTQTCNCEQKSSVYLLLCSPVRYKKAFRVALRSSLIFSWKNESTPTVRFQKVEQGLSQKCPDLQWIAYEGMRQLHQRKAKVCHRVKTPILTWCFCVYRS